MNPGSSTATTVTAPAQSNPPETSETLGPASAAPGMAGSQDKRPNEAAKPTASIPCTSHGPGPSAGPPADPRQVTLSSPIPAATRTVAAMRVRPNGSRNTSVAMIAPKITLVSRSAAIGASAPRVWAHSTRP
jgi:hypothetical protein